MPNVTRQKQKMGSLRSWGMTIAKHRGMAHLANDDADVHTYVRAYVTIGTRDE
jgi:hypothetical protein